MKRFSFEIFYNNKQVTYGQDRVPYCKYFNIPNYVDRDLDFVGNCTTFAKDDEYSHMKCEDYWKSTDYKTQNVFENSWECSQMSKELSNLISMVFRMDTEDFINRKNKVSPERIKHVDGHGRSFRFDIIDNEFPTRNVYGAILDYKQERSRMNELLKKRSIKNLSDSEIKELDELKAVVRNATSKVRIFSLTIPSDIFSNSDRFVVKTISKIWDNFNVEFVKMQQKAKVLDTSRFNEAYTGYNELIAVRNKLKAKRDEETSEVEVAIINNEINSINTQIKHITSVYFRGIYSIMKYWMGKQELSNRFSTIQTY